MCSTGRRLGLGTRSAAEIAGHFLFSQRQQKVYDQFKNKFHEKKSWANSVTAKAAQAVFLCLVHNLMVYYEAVLAKAGIVNAAEEMRRAKVLTKRTTQVEKAGRIMPLIIAGFQRLTQRTVKFIRWLRRFLWHEGPLDDLLRILKKRYATFYYDLFPDTVHFDVETYARTLRPHRPEAKWR